MPSKIYIYFAALIIVVGFVKWAHSTVDMGGYNRAKTEMASDRDNAIAVSQKKSLEIIKLKKDLKDATGKTITIVKKVKDPSGCLDTPLNDVGLNFLLGQ